MAKNPTLPTFDTHIDGLAVGPDGTHTNPQAAIDTLAHLVAHDTGSSPNPAICKSNTALVQELRHSLERLGLETRYAEEEYPPGSHIMHATMVARMGPKDIKGGVVLSSHTDVIPVTPEEYKDWKSGQPFQLEHEPDDRLVGRGSVDMKRAIVDMLTIAKMYEGKHDQLRKPVYIALSWGEEIGCKGTPTVSRLLHEIGADPDLIIVGEPTNEKLVIGQKGAASMEVNVETTGGHSSTPPKWVDARKYMMAIMLKLDALQEEYIKNVHGTDDKGFDPPYPIINCGTGEWGPTANSVPSNAKLEIHVRSTGTVSVEKLEEQIRSIIKSVETKLKTEADAKGLSDRASISLIKKSHTAALPLQTDQKMLKLLKDGMQNIGIKESDPVTVAFATEAGGLAQEFPSATTVILGTGRLEQGAHAKDEHITGQQLTDGPRFPLMAIGELCIDPGSNTPDIWMHPTVDAERVISPQAQKGI